jgi:3-oxoacyl-[acyl-carrier-protein] synthase-3
MMMSTQADPQPTSAPRKLGQPLKGVTLTGVGAAVPPTVIKNEQLTALVDTSDEWIQRRTGIVERHVLSGDETLAALAIEAAKKALAHAQVAAEAIDLVIVATTTPDERYPAVAARVQAALGIPAAAGFDLALACTGFVASVITAEQFLRTGLYKKALVVGADAHSRVMDWTDRNTCVLFGDAAGAVVLEASDTVDGFLACEAHLDGTKGDELHADHVLVNCPLVPPPTPRSPYLQMNGREVFKFTVAVVADSITTTAQQAGLTLEDLDYVVLHQANSRIMEAMTERLSLPPEKLVMNLQRYGNTSAASVPLALQEAVTDGRITEGSTVLLCGFGGGLAWASTLFKWGRLSH